MHFARPSFQQSQIGNVITRPKKDWCIIIGNMAACLSSLLSLPFPPQTPFSRWIAPRLFVVALLQIRHYDAAVPTSGVPRGLRTVSGSAPPSTLPIRPIPCLSSVSRQVLCTRSRCWESSLAVLDILLSTVQGCALPATRISVARYSQSGSLI